jgi:hypothetical protein
MRGQSLKRSNESITSDAVQLCPARGRAAYVALLHGLLPAEPMRAQTATPSAETSRQADEAFRAGYQAVKAEAGGRVPGIEPKSAFIVR